MIRLAVLLLVAGCPGAPSRPQSVAAEPEAPPEDLATRLAQLYGQLREDILSSYERDEPPEHESGMIAPRIGTARIGAGPGDLYLSGELARAPSRWPLDVDRATRTDARSKRLDIHIAADETAAWMADEVSWRIEMCGRIAVIPLRITALYAHDGDRWVPVFEHLSFGWKPRPLEGPLPKSIKTEVASGDLRDELSGVVGRGLLRTPRDPQVAAQDASALVIGPDVADEWRAKQVLQAQLPAGKLEERRVGLVGRDPATATIAYWIGNYIADVPAPPAAQPVTPPVTPPVTQPAQPGAQPAVAVGKSRMRVTHVFEKRRRPPPGPVRERNATADNRAPARDNKGKDGKDNDRKDTSADHHWQLVQTHMSQPISDDELTRMVFGSALRSAKPLQLDCSDGVRAPAAVPRRTAEPPAARTP